MISGKLFQDDRKQTMSISAQFPLVSFVPEINLCNKLYTLC